MIVCGMIHMNSNAAVLLLSAQIARNERERGGDRGDMNLRGELWPE